jgi:heme exporter protein B
MSTATVEKVARVGFWSKTGALAQKDLRVEWRARETLPPMLVFVLAVSFLLAFTLPANVRIGRALQLPVGAVAFVDVLAGFFWITVLFAGLIGFARTFEIERQEEALDSMLLVPLDRTGFFLAKAIVNLTFIVAIQIVLIPVFAILFGIGFGVGTWALPLVVVLADIGFVAAGTLFASVAAQTTTRELMLPILALPVLVPVFIAATELTSDLMTGASIAETAQRGWFGILVAYDIIVGITAALSFEFAIE